MTAVIKRVVDGEGREIGFRFVCPGCGAVHIVYTGVAHPGPKWGFNGSVDRPTFTPSVLVTSGHFVQGHDGGSCWCTYNAERPGKTAPFNCYRCHSFVTDGMIQFLGDCTHDKAGQTVALPALAGDD